MSSYFGRSFKKTGWTTRLLTLTVILTPGPEGMQTSVSGNVPYEKDFFAKHVDGSHLQWEHELMHGMCSPVPFVSTLLHKCILGLGYCNPI